MVLPGWFDFAACSAMSRCLVASIVVVEYITTRMVKSATPTRKRYRRMAVEASNVNGVAVWAIMTTATSHKRVVIVSVTCSFVLSRDFDCGVSPDSPSRMPVTLMRRPVM